jgi:hypothetical protein
MRLRQCSVSSTTGTGGTRAGIARRAAGRLERQAHLTRDPRQQTGLTPTALRSLLTR